MCLTVTLPIFVILQKQDLFEKFDGFFFKTILATRVDVNLLTVL